MRFVMVFVQVPEKTMHYIFVRKPCNGFHDDEHSDCNKYINDHISINVYFFRKLIVV